MPQQLSKLYYPQISLEDYQIFRKFVLPGEFPETHEQWIESIESHPYSGRGCGASVTAVSRSKIKLDAGSPR